ncbi:MAG: 50S ribosome-binding GTPase, partial [Sphingomonadales bacterium]|nr:50S ribosome-binding GTPase [Sphingomonadales bacterium]
KTRTLHRENRSKVPFPVVALVGYTNAGKSTLFNRLTDAKVSARDRLFETLDPTMRAINLPSGQKIILSDTVGFISHLPHELVAAFRATLEEVLAADLILHVRDMHSPDRDEQKQDVFDVMDRLGLDKQEIPILECQNKVDLLDNEEKELLNHVAVRKEDITTLSAQTGEGVDTLLADIEALLTKGDAVLNLKLSFQDGEAISWLYEHGDVLERVDSEKGIELTVRLNQKNKAKYEHLYPNSSQPS